MKSESPEATFGVDSEEIPAPADPEDDLDHEQMEVTREEQERIDVDDPPEGASPGTSEQIPSGVGGLFLAVWTFRMTHDLSRRDDKVRRSPHG